MPGIFSKIPWISLAAHDSFQFPSPTRACGWKTSLHHPSSPICSTALQYAFVWVRLFSQRQHPARSAPHPWTHRVTMPFCAPAAMIATIVTTLCVVGSLICAEMPS